ncbi:glycosyltransferase family 4 protein [Minwuia sp.]|uniref:glycosyltransferase family 4 protein n=1 Tax=Minwuia sp. TaxID=2493630 RepID=UPI003A8FE948
MKIALITDAWTPQVNGVVRTWGRVIAACGAQGHEVLVVSPNDFRTVPLPTYPEIRIAVRPGGKLKRMLDGFQPDAIHIATEGPLGFAARRYCLKYDLPFTTSYHTKFPEYISARAPVPLAWGYRLMRWFHRPSRGVLVATTTIRRELEAEGFDNIVDWTRGVDTDVFRPGRPRALEGAEPLYLYVGRVAVEKNLRAFLDLDLPGEKAVVGGGPQLEDLKRDYPEVLFPGPKFGEELAAWYRSATVFVFPSRTDTFGLVLLEALASGVPVAAFPVPGPLDVIGHDGPGVLSEDLARAVMDAACISAESCRAHAMRFSWDATAAIFLDNLAVFERKR